MKYALTLLIIILTNTLTAQSCERVWLSGKVVDTMRPQSFYNLMIVNRTTGKGVFGQPDGSFGVYVSPNDSITLSVKDYYMVGFRVAADSNCKVTGDFIISHKATELNEYVVKPLKSLQQVKEERALLAMRETRTITGLEGFQSPITFLYQRFSKSEKAKAEIAQMEYRDSKVQVVQELLRLYVAYDVIDLSEEEFLEFIDFLALDENFLKTASDMELITFIKDKFEHYKRIQN